MDEVRVSLSEFKGHTDVDVRVYTEFEGDSEKRRTKKGITVRPDLLPELLTALHKAETEARAAGLLVSEPERFQSGRQRDKPLPSPGINHPTPSRARRGGGMSRKETSEILSRLRSARVIVWLGRGGLYYRGPAPAVDLLLPEIEAHREDIAAELRRRTHAPVISGRLRLKP